MDNYVGKSVREMPPHVYAIGNFNKYYNGCLGHSSVIVQFYTTEKFFRYIHLLLIVANYALENLKTSQTSQSIIVSGEAGSGKSETSKHLIRYLSHETAIAAQIEEKMSIITPILEAFGNAKTFANNNSSRFGNYIEVRACIVSQ